MRKLASHRVAQMAGALGHRHHRHRRFHIRRESLGQGYMEFVPLPLCPPVPASGVAATAEKHEVAAEAERELGHQVSRKGMKACVMVLLLIWLGLHYKWFVALCWMAAHAWPDLHR